MPQDQKFELPQELRQLADRSMLSQEIAAVYQL